MKKRHLVPLALAACLAALPLGAQAATVNVPGVNFDGTGGNASSYLGVRLQTLDPANNNNNNNTIEFLKADGTYDDSITAGIGYNSNLYNLLSGVTMTNVGGANTSMIAGVATTDFDGTYNLGAVNISGTASSQMHGFLFNDRYSADTATYQSGDGSDVAKYFTGKITGGDITLVNTSTNGETYGAKFNAGAKVTSTSKVSGIEQGINGNITFGDISVTGNSWAAGFTSGRIAKDKSVTIDSVNVNSLGTTNKANAAGVHINDAAWSETGYDVNLLPGGTLTVKDTINVHGNQSAVGLLFKVGGGGSAMYDTNTTVKLSDVDVTASNVTATAYGIHAKNLNSSITTGDLTMNSAQGTAAGINLDAGISAAGTLNTGDMEVNAAVKAMGLNAAGAVAGKVTLGDIKAAGANVDGVSGNATGIAAAAITGAVNNPQQQVATQTFATGNIDVTADAQAVGVDVTGAITNVKDAAGKNAVSFGEIKANATADNNGAAGSVYAAGIRTTAALSNFTVDKNITAEANGTNAWADGLSLKSGSTVNLDGTKSELTVMGTASGVGGESYGIATFDNGGTAGNTTINVAGRVNVLGNNQMGNSESIVPGADAHLGIDATNGSLADSDGSINVQLQNGSHLVTNGIRAGATTGAININTQKDANGNATARYDIGGIYGGTKLTITNQAGITPNNQIDANGSTTVSVNLAASQNLAALTVPNNFNAVTIGERVNLEVYGDVADSVQNPDVPNWNVNDVMLNGTIAGTPSYQNLSVFTDWALTNGDDNIANTYSIKYNGIRQKAYMNDGFLAALMIHQRNAVFNAARDHMISFGGNRAYRGQECDPCAPVSECDPCEEVAMCDPCDPCGTMGSKSRRGFGLGSFTKGASTRNAWVNYIGRSDSYESSYNGQDWKIGMDGVQVGTDLYRTNRGQFGVIFGYEGGNAYNALDRVQADDVYIGMYGARVLRGGADVRFALSYGWQDYTMNRSSRILPPQPRALYVSNFEGNTLEANLELGKRFYRGCWSFRPVMGLDLTSNEIDAAQETAAVVGMDGPLGYSNSRLTQAFARVGSDLRFQRNRFTFNSGMYLAYDLRGQDLDAQVTRLTAPVYSTKLAGSELGRTLLTFNVGGSYQLCKNLSVFGGYQGEALLGGDAGGYMSTGHVGGAWRW